MKKIKIAVIGIILMVTSSLIGYYFFQKANNDNFNNNEEEEKDDDVQHGNNNKQTIAPSELEVIEYFSNQYNINKNEIKIVTIQKCTTEDYISKETIIQNPTNIYLILVIANDNTTYQCYYNVSNRSYDIKYIYVSEYPEVFSLFINASENGTIYNRYSRVNETINAAPLNIFQIDYDGSRIPMEIEEGRFDAFNLSYFENQTRLGNLFRVFAYWEQDPFYDFYLLSGAEYIVDMHQNQVIYWDDVSVG